MTDLCLDLDELGVDKGVFAVASAWYLTRISKASASRSLERSQRGDSGTHQMKTS
jgi:hypothetical protein